jgi:hypothetical protein
MPLATGIYEIKYATPIGSTASVGAQFRALLGNTEILGSAISQDTRGQSNQIILFNKFQVLINPIDILAIQGRADATTTLAPNQGSIATTRPSITLSIIRVQ